ncbi:MAG: phage holin family protein [Candidatus Spechtbacterales bacterium]
MTEFSSLFGTSQMQVIVALVFIDLVLAVLAALFKKEFTLGKLGNFMHGSVVKYVLGFAVIELVALAAPAFGFLVPMVFIIVVIALGSSVLRHLGKFGIPLPKMLR